MGQAAENQDFFASHSGLVESFEDAAGRTIAVVIRPAFAREKYNFVTPPESALQVGVSFYRSGELIQPHLHPERRRVVTQSQECIVVRRGELTAYLFDADRRLLAQVPLREGDVFIQFLGGHGFRVNADTEIIEVKQGPFGGDGDKIRFQSSVP